MIALIEGQYYTLAPTPILSNELSLKKGENSTIEAYIGTNRVEYGVFFYSLTKGLDINAKTGQYAGKSGKIRAIFHDRHVDLTLTAG